ncbi:MAG TPA: hypothetical protein PKN96_10145 [Flavobacterium sp.]|uniref:hypothetical protein n=1 Tax=Flavobacterium sp. TaxID=239 RepID=UPI002BDDE994|nr:hypothetical protein [Flavobacterium sp.]HNP33642.1 hypothetical protein [Flavobacterium sp.]
MEKAKKLISKILVITLILFSISCDHKKTPQLVAVKACQAGPNEIIFKNTSTTVQRFYIVNYAGANTSTTFLMFNKQDDFTLNPGASVHKTYNVNTVGICSPSKTLALGIFDYGSVRNVISVSKGHCCEYNGVTVSDF